MMYTTLYSVYVSDFFETLELTLEIFKFYLAPYQKSTHRLLSIECFIRVEYILVVGCAERFLWRNHIMSQADSSTFFVTEA